MKKHLSMPDKEANGFIATLNQQGYMTSTIDRYMAAFIDYATNCPMPCLDIGAAYGIATIAALEQGAKMIANDIDIRHLEILKSRLPKNLRSKLQLIVGSFPDGVNLPNNSIGGILVARVLHFFKPDELIHAASRLHDWLMPNGKVFLTAETPYLKLWESFIPVYEDKKVKGDIWAGQIDDVSKYAPHRGSQLPKKMLALDPDVLRYVFEKAGFKIDVVDFFARPEFPDDLKLNGKESVGMICTKASK